MAVMSPRPILKLVVRGNFPVGRNLNPFHLWPTRDMSSLGTTKFVSSANKSPCAYPERGKLGVAYGDFI